MSVTTRDFFELVKAIGESKSKQEEDRIIAEEVRPNHTIVKLGLVEMFDKYLHFNDDCR